MGTRTHAHIPLDCDQGRRERERGGGREAAVEKTVTVVEREREREKGGIGGKVGRARWHRDRGAERQGARSSSLFLGRKKKVRPPFWRERERDLPFFLSFPLPPLSSLQESIKAHSLSSSSSRRPGVASLSLSCLIGFFFLFPPPVLLILPTFQREQAK